MNEIAVISMCRNDEFHVQKWISYYGAQFGTNNLYLILDGHDQEKPTDPEVNCIRVPHIPLSRSEGDRNRSRMVSSYAKALFKRYKRVIACDIDEFLILDPSKKISLYSYLLQTHKGSNLSAMGIDLAQNIDKESSLDLNKAWLEQRKYAVISSRYTKPVVALKPLTWGSGFHRIKGRNFHLKSDLYLLHTGNVDFEKATGRNSDQSRLDQGWEGHLKRRFEIFQIVKEGNVSELDKVKSKAFKILNYKRPPYAWNKPGTSISDFIVELPDRFKGIL